MILNCSNCSTRFLIDTNALGDTGRTVRCGRCGHAWFQVPVVPEQETYEPPPLETPPLEPSSTESAPLPAFDPELAPPPPLASDPDQPYEPPPLDLDGLDDLRAAPIPPPTDGSGEPPKNRRRLILWAVLVVIVAAILFGLYRYRDTIVAAWPGAATVFAEVGVPIATPPGLGLVVQPDSVLSRRESVNDEAFLVIEGVIKNATDKALPVGSIRITLRGKDDKYLRRWEHTPDSRTLPAGATMQFLTRIKDPPPSPFETQFEFLPQN